jgi:hypothetical protein
MAKKDYSSVPKPDIPEVIKLAIATYELEWWMRKLSRKQVREEIKKATSIDVKAKTLPVVLFYYAEIYGKWKRKPESKNTLLDDAGWTRLRTVVESLKNHLESPLVDHVSAAAVVVMSKVSTNWQQLNGLPKRLWYWKRD